MGGETSYYSTTLGLLVMGKLKSVYYNTQYLTTYVRVVFAPALSNDLLGDRGGIDITFDVSRVKQDW